MLFLALESLINTVILVFMVLYGYTFKKCESVKTLGNLTSYIFELAFFEYSFTE